MSEWIHFRVAFILVHLLNVLLFTTFSQKYNVAYADVSNTMLSSDINFSLGLNYFVKIPTNIFPYSLSLVKVLISPFVCLLFICMHMWKGSARVWIHRSKLFIAILLKSTSSQILFLCDNHTMQTLLNQFNWSNSFSRKFVKWTVSQTHIHIAHTIFYRMLLVKRAYQKAFNRLLSSPQLHQLNRIVAWKIC